MPCKESNCGYIKIRWSLHQNKNYYQICIYIHTYVHINIYVYIYSYTHTSCLSLSMCIYKYISITDFKIHEANNDRNREKKSTIMAGDLNLIDMECFTNN